MLKTKIILSGFLPTLLCSFALAKSRVIDSQRELTALKVAVEKAFNSKCPRVQKDSIGKYSLALDTCLPIQTARLIGKQALLGGPNCYNFALISLGVLDSLRAVNSEELESLYLSSNSAFCRKLSSQTPAQPGDFISLEDRVDSETSKRIHAYIHLTKKYVLTKNGPDTTSSWTIATQASVLEAYPVTRESISLDRYECTQPVVVTPLNISQSLSVVSAFSRFMSEIQLHPTLSRQTVLEAKRQISVLAKTLSQNALGAIYANRENPEARLKLFEVVSQFVAIKNMLYEIRNTSDKDAEIFKASAFEYLEILNRILSLGDESFGAQDVSSPEDSLEYEYCEQQKRVPKICQ